MANVGNVGLSLAWRKGSAGTVQLHKREDLNMKPRPSQKSWAWQRAPVTPVLGAGGQDKWRQVDPGSSLASCELFQGQRGSLFQTIKWRIREDI